MTEKILNKKTKERIAKLQFALIVSIAATILTACGTVHPIRPEKEPERPLPQVPNSSLTVPIWVDVPALSEQINGHFSSTQGPSGIFWTTNKYIGNGLNLRMGIHRSASTNVATNNDCLVIDIPIAVNDGRIDWKQERTLRAIHKHVDFGGSGTAQARACISIGEDWKLRATITPDSSWISDAWIDLGPPFEHIKTDIAERVDLKLREKLPAVSKTVTDMISTIPIKPIIERAWAAVQQSFPLSHDPLIMAGIEPISIGVKPTVSQGLKLVVRPTIVAKFRGHVGSDTEPRQIKPLPANTGRPGGDEFLLSIKVDVPFVDLTELARARIVGRTYELDNGRTVTPSAASISSAGDKLLLRVDFSAKLSSIPITNYSGWLYLTGTPKYDDTKRLLKVDDINFDLNTRNLLVDEAAALLHDHFLQQLREALVFDLSDKTDPIYKHIKTGAQETKIADDVILKAVVKSLNVSDIHIGSDGIGIFVTANGTSSLVINPTIK